MCESPAPYLVSMGSHSIQNKGNSHSSLSGSEANRIAWLKLKLVPGLGNRSVLRLLESFGTPENVLSASLRDLNAIGRLRETALRALAAKQYFRDPLAEWDKIKQNNIRLLCLGDADYPSNLAGIPDPPAVLFTSGAVEPRDLVSIAVVGSRFASPAGIVFTERLCSDLAASGVTVVSGFAVGIDSAAHRGALRARGRTLAVLGCGLDINYPSINSDLRRELDGHGALLTEFTLGTPPASGNFPGRNRIISGLSLGVVVVEAAERSGSLITARFALEQGREVFAVPGMAQSTRSTGPHMLLKQGARLVEGVEDILAEIRPLIQRSRAPIGKGCVDTAKSEREAVPVHLPPGSDSGEREPGFIEATRDESNLLRVVEKIPKHIDEIANLAGMPVQRAAAILLALELRGLVSQLPGKYFISSRTGK